MGIFTKVFGDPNERIIKHLQASVDQINNLEKEYKNYSQEQLKELTQKFKKQLHDGSKLDEILPPAFAAIREAAKKTLGQRHFDVQLIGGMVLHRGQIAEMKTGEGKTLSATLPLYLNSLEGKGCHLVTVNDYLARRDTVWMGQIYYYLGMNVGCIQHDAAFLYDPQYKITSDDDSMDRDSKRDVIGSFHIEHSYLRPVSRKEAYLADITYGTNNEFGFDYLRDNMVYDAAHAVQRDLHFAIVDEVDSILIDEARTPLIISAPDMQSSEMYYKFSELVKRLEKNKDYNIDEKMNAVTLSEQGISKMEKWLSIDNIYTQGGITLVHHIEQALRAQALFHRDKQYVVKDGEIVIVDEFTGRLMFGRRYSEGLHQAIEAKEGVKVQHESKTLATITFQNYFRLYKKLAGMTGTAATEAEEFSKIYSLDVTSIPTNKPMIRKDFTDQIYKTEMGKFQAVVREVKEKNAKGQPVLLGTISIEKNELLGKLMEHEGLRPKILNAKHHEQEGQIIAQAGRVGVITVATNMAGRGVDIILGGNPPDPDEAKKVKELGGLHIIGTERHEARRIDNQLRGRAGRQGDQGSSQFYISTEDDLMRIFGSDKIKSIMETLKIPDDMPITTRMISRSIEAAQKKVEGHNFDIRKHLVEYDDVMNKHREVVYRKRKELLLKENIRDDILEMVEKEIEHVVYFHTAQDSPSTWNIKEIYEVMRTIFPYPKEKELSIEGYKNKNEDRLTLAEMRTKIINHLFDLAKIAYQDLEKNIEAMHGNLNTLRKIEKSLALQAIDTLWIEHLEAMDHLRTGIGLRGYGQRDPLVEYKKEAFRMFGQLLNLVLKQVVYGIYKVTAVAQAVPGFMPFRNIQYTAPVKEMQERKSHIATQTPGEGSMMRQSESRQSQNPLEDKRTHYQGRKVGRNEPCPCGATKPDGTPIKFKHCHGR